MNLSNFLRNHYYNVDTTNLVRPTHTRIKNESMRIQGGIYHIPIEKQKTFLQYYYDHVFGQDIHEYLTEVQPETGPLVVDIDLHFPIDIATRQYTLLHIKRLIGAYVHCIYNMVSIPPATEFPVFVMEKPTVYQVPEKSITKDGIHLLFGLRMHRALQQMIRGHMLKWMPVIFKDLPIINDWTAVLDESVTKGSSNWQMYGSRKPGCSAYTLTHWYSVSATGTASEPILDPDMAEAETSMGFTAPTDALFPMLDEKNVNDFCFKTNLVMLSVQNQQYIEVSPSEPYVNAYNQLFLHSYKSRQSPSASSATATSPTNARTGKSHKAMIDLWESIVDKDSLQDAVDTFLSELTSSEYRTREIHECTQILPAKFYESGSHDLNTKVAFALKRTDERMFVSWILLRSKADDFDYASIPTLIYRWQNHLSNKFGSDEKCITGRSIMYWAKQYAPEEYSKIRSHNIHYFIDLTLKTDVGDYDFAMVLYHMFKEQYICSNIEGKKWYQFQGHRWVEDSGYSLRRRISEDMYMMYDKLCSTKLEELKTIDPTSDTYKTANKQTKAMLGVRTKLRRTCEKNNIMREAMEIFYDAEFDANKDENPYLMCFTNGVVDFKSKEFRPGVPQDYITKTTAVPYIASKDWTTRDAEIADEVRDFMKQLYPQESLCDYVWRYDAAVLIGIKKENIFAIHCGSGCNGKSKKMELMDYLKDYSATISVSVITEKRPGIGNTSSEIAKLKGARFVYMKEPSKGAVVNEGLLKELTGGEKIEARALYKNSEEFFPQFSLSVALNELFDFRSNDDGTWRRVKIINYLSKFAMAGETFPVKPAYTFPKNKNLSAKFKEWAPIYMSMLVEIAFKTEGEVVDCPEVVEASTAYRHSQDVISKFITECIIKDDTSSVGKRILSAAFKEWFSAEFGTTKRPPKMSEVEDAVTRIFGAKSAKAGGHTKEWRGIRIVMNDSDDEM